MGRPNKNAGKPAKNVATNATSENKQNQNAAVRSCTGCPLAKVNPKNEKLQTCPKRPFAFSVGEKGLPGCK